MYRFFALPRHPLSHWSARASSTHATPIALSDTMEPREVACILLTGGVNGSDIGVRVEEFTDWMVGSVNHKVGIRLMAVVQFIECRRMFVTVGQFRTKNSLMNDVSGGHRRRHKQEGKECTHERPAIQ